MKNKLFVCYFKSLIFLITLIVLLCIVNTIPNSYIKNNLITSINFYKDIDVKPYIDSMQCTTNDASADSTALNLMMNCDSTHPIHSALYAPAYRDFSTQDFISMAYTTIVDGVSSNYNYNRYWHGYQILWRPLLVFMDARSIMFFMCALYTVFLLYFVYRLFKSGYKAFAIGFVLMNVFYIVPIGFNALEYIPLFYITLIMSFLVYCNKFDIRFVLCCSGIAIAFFDFLTAETLTLTVPLLLYVHLNKKEVPFKNVVISAFNWLIGYCFTFLFKWIISSIVYKTNFVQIAVDKYNTHVSGFSPLASVKMNVNVLLFSLGTTRHTFICFSVFICILLLIVYLFRSKYTSTLYLYTALLLGMVPYIRYYVISDHSWGYAFFTYRAQLILIPIIVLLLSELNVSLFKIRRN